MTTPLTSDEIREWAINHRINIIDKNDYQSGYDQAIVELISHIDFEPILREIIND